MGTQMGTRWLSDSLFDLFGVGDKGKPAPNSQAVPVNPNSSTTPGVPVSSVDPRIPVIENAKAQSLAAAEQSKTTAELVKQQLVQQASQKSSTEMLASIDKNIKDMADATRLGNEQRGKGVRYSQHIALSQG
jgi:type V secretory pathway adhesin AidA